MQFNNNRALCSPTSFTGACSWREKILILKKIINATKKTCVVFIVYRLGFLNKYFYTPGGSPCASLLFLYTHVSIQLMMCFSSAIAVKVLKVWRLLTFMLICEQLVLKFC